MLCTVLFESTLSLKSELIFFNFCKVGFGVPVLYIIVLTDSKYYLIFNLIKKLDIYESNSLFEYKALKKENQCKIFKNIT